MHSIWGKINRSTSGHRWENTCIFCFPLGEWTSLSMMFNTSGPPYKTSSTDATTKRPRRESGRNSWVVRSQQMWVECTFELGGKSTADNLIIAWDTLTLLDMKPAIRVPHLKMLSCLVRFCWDALTCWHTSLLSKVGFTTKVLFPQLNQFKDCFTFLIASVSVHKSKQNVIRLKMSLDCWWDSWQVSTHQQFLPGLYHTSPSTVDVVSLPVSDLKSISVDFRGSCIWASGKTAGIK